MSIRRRPQFLGLNYAALTGQLGVPVSANVLYHLNAGTVALADAAAVAAGDWVDQSTHARGALQSIAGATYRASILGKPCVEFNGTDGTALSAAFTYPAVRRVFIVTRSLLGLDVGRLIEGSSNNTGQITGNTNILRLQTGGAQVAEVGGYEKQSSFTVAEAYFNGAVSTLRINASFTNTGNPGDSEETSGFRLASAGGGTVLFLGVQVFEVVIGNSSLSAGEISQIRNYLLTKYSANHGQRLIYCGGDSLTAGTGSTGGQTYPAQLLAMYSEPAMRVNNAGQANATAVDADTTADSSADTLVTAGGNYYGCDDLIAVMWAGTNDIHFGADDTDTYANIVAMCENRQTSGWTSTNRARVAVCTIIARSSFDATKETYRQSVNTSIRNNYAGFADVLVDLADDARLSDAEDATYFSDGVHLTNTGYGVVADLVYAAIG